MKHGPEGAIMMAEPKVSVIERFKKIYEAYGLEYTNSDKELITLLINCHDLHGVNATGEHSLAGFGYVVSRLKEIYNNSKRKVTEGIFLLWIINCADIIASTAMNKWVLHDSIWGTEAAANKFFDGFFGSFKGKQLLRDLSAVLEIAQSEDEYAAAITAAEKTAATRMVNLLNSSLFEAAQAAFPTPQKLADILEKAGINADILRDPAKNTLTDTYRKLRNDPKAAADPEITAMINTCELRLRMAEKFGDEDYMLLTVRNILKNEMKNNWAGRLTRIGQMDYCLGVVRKIAAYLLTQAKAELTPGSNIRTGYLYTRKNLSPVDWQSVDVNSYNASFMIEGFAAVLIGLIADVADMLPETGFYNVEFQNLLDRLSDSKCAKLLYLDGAYRSGETRAAIIEALMIYSMK